MSELLARGRTHLHALARAPRAAGSPADTAARHYAAAVLERAGFATSEHPFTYSRFPGQLATPLFGLLAAAMLVLAAMCGRAGSPGRALVVLVVAGAALGAAGTWLARRGVLAFPAMRAAGVNLRAARPGASPKVWLVAHTDSKSQPVPQAARAAGIVALALSIVWMAGLGAGALAGWFAAAPGAWSVAAAAGVLAALPVAASFVGNRSHGALDNASGLASVLLAAESLPPGADVGVLVTAAEELGLAGARAWAATQPLGQIALNCDGIDDVGTLVAMRSGRRGERVLRAMAGAARDHALPYREIMLVPGVLVDAVALADAGWQTATLSRGTLATLARVHTAHDSLERLAGTGIPEAAVVLAAAAQRLADEAR